MPLVLAAMGGALIIGPFPLTMLLLAAPVGLVLALWSPAAMVGLLTLSVPLQAVGAEPFGPVQVTFAKALVVGAAAGWGLRVVSGRARMRIAGPAWFLAAHVAVVAASVVQARSIAAWSTEFYRWWSGLVVYVVAVDAIRDRAAAIPALAGIAVGTTASSLLAFYQVATHAGPASFDVGGLTRAYAKFGQPNPFAGYLEVGVPLLVAVVVCALVPALRGAETPLPRWLVAWCAGGAATGAVALGLTQSRGGWIGFAAGLGAIAWLTGPAVRWPALGFGLALAVLATTTPLGGRALQRLTTGVGEVGPRVQVTRANFAVQERLAHWRAGIRMVRAHPVLGVGAGNFEANFRDATAVWRFRVSRGHAHNAYIQAAAQTGLVGLTTYLLFLVALAARLRRALRGAAASGALPLVVGAIGVSLAFAIHNLFDYLHVLTLPVQLGVVWALAEVGANEAADQERPTAPETAGA